MSSTEAALLSLAEDVIGLTDLGEFRTGLLEALCRVVPSEYASLNDLGPGPDDATVIGIPEPALTRESVEAFVRYRHENPIARHFARTQDGRAYRFSDLISRRELRGLALYEQVYAPLGIQHQIAFTLQSSPNRLLAVALSRTHRNYTIRERELLNRARPVLIQAFRNAIALHDLESALARSRGGSLMTEALTAAGLTDREAQIIGQLAHGQSKRDIASSLGISQRTVAKHLERLPKARRQHPVRRRRQRLGALRASRERACCRGRRH